ncbi:WXG100 family type VII secretion target [Nonomuraea sp. K274]|uniref:WXG100 family type VII secretion target n=1 Tax=Nonomuraea cypriaca TaxID=1187855 RepID=A0A931EVB1_9ACTN|nr:WXG100 family type VII secretion target [Nonomuraea cypriaca]MBF8185449.1 WXG100 family type VII secretion target [Nonomuraea cypriaca]
MSAELDFTKVNFGQMEMAEGDYVKILGSFERATDELLVKLKNELTGHWEGPGGAEEYFRQHEQRWQAAADQMRTQLDELRTALRIANENYRMAENRNKSIWADG